MSHTDHDQINDAVSYQFMIEGHVQRWPLRSSWKEAAKDAIEHGTGKWANSLQSTIYLQDYVQILRIPRAVPRR